MPYFSDTCPCCGSPNMYFQSLDTQDGAYVQTWYCDACASEGHDWYTPSERIVHTVKGQSAETDDDMIYIEPTED